ncbi:MEDS domain-containing protein [Prauserella oleivorans]|uniref:MEDS domain-containing protein n=1 Tax=Prauserella oleivorans TaxID=1478153 RepID=A0ABW5WET7_9PSEU
MRVCGEVENTELLGPYANVCWAFDRPPEFERRALRFLADGLAQGQQVWYIADAPERDLLRVLRGLAGADEALTSGAAKVAPLGRRYTSPDPESQVRTYADALDEALADGFSGLRVAADGTGLLEGRGGVDHLARYEHLVDRHMAHRPFSALCAYNRRRLGRELVAEVACMHPITNVGAAPFRLFATDEAAIGLSGELDLAAQRLLSLALERADPQPRSGELAIDATAVTFMDHRSLLLLSRFAERRGATAVVRTKSAVPARVMEVLRLPGVRVEPVG